MTDIVNLRKKGMPWWRQSHAEILSDMNLRACFPRGSWLQGCSLYMILKALTSAQYEKDEIESCTFAIGLQFLVGQCEGELSKETIIDWIGRIIKRGVITKAVADDFILTITIHRLYFEVDKYRMDNRYKETDELKAKRKEREEKELIRGSDEHFAAYEEFHASVGKIC